MKGFWKVFGVVVLVAGVTACSSSSSPVSPASPAVASDVSAAAAGRGVPAKPGALTIVGIVLQEDGEFDVLQAAVVRAGLVDALNGRPQYTVFAPTDLAFITTLGAADEAAAIAAVNSLPLDDLRNILLFHVTNGRRTSTSVLAAPSYSMLNGSTLTRDQLQAAGIITPDVMASNGVIHVIGRVLLP
jgi:uncharacterized surface protein with fasciclin (FAS1) repeats